MKTKDLTSGSIIKGILIFTFPLLLGNLFQQMYNTVDSIVVGKYVGKAALAAVGASSTIINTLIGFFMGLSAGGSVAVAQYFGAKDSENVKRSIQSFFSFTVILSVLFTIIGVGLSPAVLRAINIPDDVMPGATAYLRIYFFGIGAVMLYNMGSAILRAVGDSKRPLFILCLSSVINIVLDLLFVVQFKMGVSGVAWATFISQVVSAIIVMVILLTTGDIYRLEIKGIRHYPDMTHRILSVGLPMGLQQSITQLSNVIVQSYINAFGSAVMAGYTACMKIDVFIVLPMQSLALAVTTFVGQNVGAGKDERAQRGTKTVVLLALGIIVPISALVFFFGRYALMLFTDEADVIQSGMLFVRVFVPFYCFLCVLHTLAGSLRGRGDAKPPMYIMLFCFVGLRQLMLTIGTRLIHSVTFVAASFPVTWIVASVWMCLYYRKSTKKLNIAALGDKNE